MLMPKIQAFGLIWERSRRTRPGTLCGLVQVQMPSSTNPYRPLMKTKWHPRDERILPRLHFGKLDDNEKYDSPLVNKARGAPVEDWVTDINPLYSKGN